MNDLIVLAQSNAPTSSWPYVLFGVAMFATAIFLILLVLVQRGRGGGLAGAFGGMGGQSAFGAKAGDTFTKVTIYASTFWILLCMAALAVLNPKPPSEAAPPAGINNPAGTGETVDGAAVDGASADGASDTAEADGVSVEADGSTPAADSAPADGSGTADGADATDE